MRFPPYSVLMARRLYPETTMNMPPRLVPALILLTVLALPAPALAQTPTPQAFTVLEDAGRILGGEAMAWLWRFGLIEREDLPAYRENMRSQQEEEAKDSAPNVHINIGSITITGPENAPGQTDSSPLQSSDRSRVDKKSTAAD